MAEVIVLCSSSESEDLPALPAGSKVIELLSDEPDYLSSQCISLSEPLHARIDRILGQNRPAPIARMVDDEASGSAMVVEAAGGGRDSFFEAFYQKWVVKAGVDMDEGVQSNGQVDQSKLEQSNGQVPKPKRAKRSPTKKRKDPSNLTPNLPIQTLPPPELPGDILPRITGRAPRTKEEACQEVTLVVDDRLNLRLQLAPQMAMSFKIAIERLEGAGMVQWRRTPWDRPGMDSLCPVCAVLVECETVGQEIESDPEKFIAALKQSITNRTRFTQIYLVLTGFKAYGQKVATRVNRSFREAVLAGERVPSATRTAMTSVQSSWQDVESRLFLACASLCEVDGIQSQFRLVFQETILNARQFVLDATRDVAFLPYSCDADSRFNFCAINAVRSGTSTAETWKLMLAQILRVTPQIAGAVAQAYPTFSALMRAYHEKGKEKGREGEVLLQNLQVNGRSLGQALSKRIYRVFTSRNPDHIIK